MLVGKCHAETLVSRGSSERNCGSEMSLEAKQIGQQAEL